MRKSSDTSSSDDDSDTSEEEVPVKRAPRIIGKRH